MAASGTNILRWSALASGLVYGIYHQATIRAADKVKAEERKYHHQQSLIEKARSEYVKKTIPGGMSSAVNQDPEDPKFDLEAFLRAKEVELAGN